MDDGWAATTAAGITVLIAEDDARVRALCAGLLRVTAGVASVTEAEDGAEAVELARERRHDVAVLDLNMPRLDGIEAAARLHALQPSLRIALQSCDPELLQVRAGGLGLPLFDKLEFDRVMEWVERQALGGWGDEGAARLAAFGLTRDLRCGVCGYGIVVRPPPPRCPLCGRDGSWVGVRDSGSHPTVANGRLAG
jgi:CheY-like chemotaxis protein